MLKSWAFFPFCISLLFSSLGGASNPRFVSEYRFWLVPGTVAMAALIAPQALDIYFSRQLEGEYKTAHFNETAKNLADTALIAGTANAVSFLDASVMLYIAFKRIDSTLEGCSGIRVARHVAEGVLASSAVLSSGCQIYATSNTMALYSGPSESREQPASLTPTLITMTISGVLSVFAGMASVALVYVSCTMKSYQYEAIE